MTALTTDYLAKLTIELVRMLEGAGWGRIRVDELKHPDRPLSVRTNYANRELRVHILWNRVEVSAISLNLDSPSFQSGGGVNAKNLFRTIMSVGDTCLAKQRGCAEHSSLVH